MSSEIQPKLTNSRDVPVVVVSMSTFNDTERAVKAVHSIFQSQTRATVMAVVVDDGSEPDTVEALSQVSQEYEHCHFFPRAHRERGFARHEAIQEAFALGANYILFMDADMQLDPLAIDQCLAAVDRSGAGAVLLREIPHSSYSNFATKVKVFERYIVSNSQQRITQNSIEAARFWSVEAWKQSRGLNPYQTAFEEIQPTIRYLKSGGKVARQRGAKLHHDEKEVLFSELFRKKAYYFGEMFKTASTEQQGFLEMFKRWYPFRWVYYEGQNVKEYIRHPILTTSMVGMYVGLTVLAVKELGTEALKMDSEQESIK